MKSKFILIFVLTALVLLFSACSSMIPITSPTAQGDQAATQQAQILQAARATATSIAIQRELSGLQTQVAQGGQPVVITATPQPPTATAEPTNTPIPTATMVPPTETPILPTATATATPIPCNAAQFVADVTISDGSILAPDSSFTKTWRLKNVGACTWTTAYDLVFTGGSQLGGPNAIDLGGNVAPGQVIDVSVNLVAPDDEGSYRGDWKLRDASGVLFGVGRSSSPFYVAFKVVNPRSDYPYDFLANMCLAEWTSGAGRLPCAGADSSASGFVQRIDRPTLESGYVDDEPALVTFPQMITDGVVRGKYPTFRVESGHHFSAVIGCGRSENNCDLNFQLDYQIADGTIQTLKVWHEVYDEQFEAVDVDLSSLAGKDVRFILTVFANGSPSQDRALWLAPRITKK